ncbi:MAG TPA: M23 family metallopeptidase [Phycisphaerales bacterium]|nr:M23 family metallopeptidase [Phycisphaerales bacterium]
MWPVANHDTSGLRTYNTVIPSGINPCPGGQQYHTGLDIDTTGTDLTVRAAASGTARVVPMGSVDADNHNMGNVVIIYHPELRLHTLYAHLASPISASNGFVEAGDPIGTMGETGCPGCGVHLHFELKRVGVIGNVSDSGPRWGYSCTDASLAGYVDPRPYLGLDVNTLSSPLAVTVPSNQAVRSGPDPVNYPIAITSVTAGQQFAAFAEHGGWYQIEFPSTDGPATGWIQAAPDLSAPLLEVNEPLQMELGVDIRSSPSTAEPPVSKVWHGQWHVQSAATSSGAGCSETWYQPHLAANAPVPLGWACGESVVSHCRVDFNNVDGLGVADIFDFLNAWLSNDPRADFNAIDGLTVQDIFDFINAWLAGC